MSLARYLIGDVFERLAELPDGSVDLVLTSPPFLALRDYLPADHPDKAKEIGAEPDPARFLDVMLRLTAEFGRVLSPCGSIAVELGDTYSGSGGGGGDYDPDGMRAGQPRFDGSARRGRRGGWPLPKSLTLLPTLYPACLAYGWNLLDPDAGPSVAGRWRVRNVKPWIRSNPPVGELGDKERPATSYVTVATRAVDRFFDLDAVRRPHSTNALTYDRRDRAAEPAGTSRSDAGERHSADVHPAGSPPLDWWHHVDAVLDAALVEFAGGTTKPRTAKKVARRASSGKTAAAGRGGNWSTLDTLGENDGDETSIRGRHLRRALERAGLIRTLDAVEVNGRGYPGAHFAVWPPELVRLLVEEMAPRHVCSTCGQPRRRIVEQTSPREVGKAGKSSAPERRGVGGAFACGENFTPATYATTGWTDCGHGTWRPGVVLDPFAGSGTTLAVCSGMGRESIGIDLDARNADLARERVGMFLDISPNPRQEVS